MPKKHNKLEAVIIIVVLLSAVIGLYYMYTVSVGKAFLQAPTFIVRQTSNDFCCCAPVANERHLFTVYGQITVDADQATKTEACTRICGEHGSATHPTKLLHTGKCGRL